MAKLVLTDKNVIGHTVEELCVKKGMTCYDLSRQCGVPLTTIMHIVNGSTKNPGIYTMVKICRELEIPLTQCLDPEI